MIMMMLLAIELVWSVVAIVKIPRMQISQISAIFHCPTCYEKMKMWKNTNFLSKSSLLACWQPSFLSWVFHISDDWFQYAVKEKLEKISKLFWKLLIDWFLMYDDDLRGE